MAMMTMMMTDYPGDDYADHKDQHKHQYLQFDLINAKKRDKKGYKNSGQIVVKSVKIEQVRKIETEMVEIINQRHSQSAEVWLETLNWGFLCLAAAIKILKSSQGIDL